MLLGARRVDTRTVEVALPNGATAFMRAVDLDDDIDSSGAIKTALRDKFDFDAVTETLGGMSQALRAALVTAAPGKVTVELGVELAIKSGVLVGLIVDGESRSSLKVTLEWGRADHTTAE
jgi:hypothetical protein